MPDEANRAGGGKRRRDATNYVVMRRPQPMVVGRASQADVAAEAYARFVGSWGNFSAHIGHRWEQLAGAWARNTIGQVLGEGEHRYTLHHVEELDHNVALHREVERVGVSCPDALFCGRDAAGRLIVQPVDFKVSLDTASFDQVEAVRVLDLATRGGEHTVAAIRHAVSAGEEEREGSPGDHRQALLDRLAAGTVTPAGGVFIAPDTAFNRTHLRSHANQQRRRPLRPADVRLVAVTPTEFCAGLPGWPEAQALLQADGVRADLPGDLGMAERYARLGAGVVGALQTIHSPLFGSAGPFSTLTDVQQLLRHHPSSLDLLSVLQERRAQRLELLRRRDQLLHLPFRMPALIEALGPPGPEQAGGWPGALLREGIALLHAAHRSRVTSEGERLLALDWDDERVLAQLEEDRPAFRRAARADLERWAAAARAAQR